MNHSEIHRVSVADQVAALLRQRIFDGELRPGTPLQEVPLASSLGVSRNTMREATRILTLEGLLRRSIHRGVAVSQLSLKDLHEIYEVRRMLEISAVLAANGSSDVLPELENALAGYEQAVLRRDWVRAVGFDLQFHSRLIGLHHNRRLETFYQKVIGELRMGMVLVDRSHDDPGRLIPVHRKLLGLLSAGKLKQCAKVLAGHLADSESRFSRILAGEIPGKKRNSESDQMPITASAPRRKK